MSLIKAALLPYLFKRWLQVHTKCNSYESKERERESPHSQLQVQSHHHVPVAKEGRNMWKGNPKLGLFPNFSNFIQHALHPKSERQEVTLEWGNCCTRIPPRQQVLLDLSSSLCSIAPFVEMHIHRGTVHAGKWEFLFSEFLCPYSAETKRHCYLANEYT